MTTFLVTGGIGSGKSTVCSFLAAKGYDVYDCDSRCKALYASVPGLVQAVEMAVGLPFGRIRDVFSDPSALRRLEDVVYPFLLDDLRRWKDSLSCGCCFIESAVALSKPCFEGLYDKVLVVSAPLALRCLRNSAALQRSAYQDPGIEHKADYLITNDSTPEALGLEVEAFIKLIENEN